VITNICDFFRQSYFLQLLCLFIISLILLFFKMIISVLGNVAEMEREYLREPQKQGIEIAKAKGRYTDRLYRSKMTEDLLIKKIQGSRQRTYGKRAVPKTCSFTGRLQPGYGIKNQENYRKAKGRLVVEVLGVPEIPCFVPKMSLAYILSEMLARPLIELAGNMNDFLGQKITLTYFYIRNVCHRHEVYRFGRPRKFPLRRRNFFYYINGHMKPSGTPLISLLDISQGRLRWRLPVSGNRAIPRKHQ
jgi:hypothetical protein